MISHLLVPFDDSDPARAALQFAVEEFPAAEITALAVIDPAEVRFGPDAPTDQATESEELSSVRAEERLHEATAIAADHDVAVQTERTTGRPAQAIIEYAETEAIDHIVMGSHGRRGVSRIMLGSVAETIVRQAPAPVTIIRQDNLKERTE